jgi:NAD(P)-dependent dehydrogenase (short-subunit alcohol dehydrogenase family)
MTDALKGKVAIVTGGASGIGRAAAIAFARDGASVIVVDISLDGEQTAAMIRQAKGEATFVSCDVSSADDVRGMVDATLKTYGRIDCAFNNAAIQGSVASIVDCTEENFDRVVRINLKGIWNCLKYQIPPMLAQGKGAIVNTSSVAGVVGHRGLPAYTAAKHGVIGLTKVAALENAALGVRINAICPGGIETPMLDRTARVIGPDFLTATLAAQPIGRLGKPQEVAEAAVWLCSDLSSFVTGHTMMVDGGWVAQ